MTLVKICGCMSVEDALNAAETGADLIGFVFAGSRRRVSPEIAAEATRVLHGDHRPLSPPPIPAEGMDVVAYLRLCATAIEQLLVDKRPLTAGVFDGQAVEEVLSLADAAQVDLIQLHRMDGVAVPDRWVVRALETDGARSYVELLTALQPGEAVAYILDSSRGRGKRGDWRLAAEAAAQSPVILSGGLSPENVAEAVRTVGPWAVDVSSGVESDGRKDGRLMREFVAAARSELQP